MLENYIYNINLLGKNIREIRAEKGFTIEAFAEKLSVSDRMVRYWESGDNYPKLEKLLDICIALEIQIELLLRNNSADVSFMNKY